MERPNGVKIEVGVDEVGRGSLIYDVVAGAVIMPTEYEESDVLVQRVRDSKKCSKRELLLLSDYIKDVAIAWGIGSASKDEVDRINIANATMLAMHRALDAVYEQVAFDKICIDGNMFKPYLTPCINEIDQAEYIPHQCIINGDKYNISIAAASIIAKVERDNSIISLCDNNSFFCDYGWKTNFGYGTKKHFDAIQQYGITEHHRRTFLRKFLSS
jgi:ribonuclease HII